MHFSQQEASARQLPSTLVERLRLLADTEILLIRHVPETPYSPALETLVAEGAVDQVQSYRLAEAIYEACGYAMKKAKLLARETQALPKRRLLHRDIYPLTVLSCVRNACHSPTRYVDMRDALARLPARHKALQHIRLLVQEGSHTRMPYTEMSMLEYEAQLQMGGMPIGHMLDFEDEMLERAIADCALDITMEPGEMAVFYNTRLYHQAIDLPGAESPARYRRVMVYTAGEAID